MSPKLLPVLAGVLVAALVGCGSTDKAGVPHRPAAQTLRLATRTHGEGSAAAFAADVNRLSEGALKIVVDHEAHRDLGRGSDAAILADVVSGAVDLGAISVESLEAVGVRSFDPLVAPGVVTTVAAEAQIAGGPLASQMLDGAVAASVVGIAIAPGPIHYLASIGDAIADPAQLAGQLFGVTATSTLAADVVRALGATPTLDDRQDTIDTNVRALDISPQGISQRQIVDVTGHVVGNVPLWPQPTIIVANTQSFGGLTTAQQEMLTSAGLQAAAQQAQAVIKDDSDALTVLCRSATWTFESLDDRGAASLTGFLSQVTDRVREDEALAPTLSRIEQLVSSITAPTDLTCAVTDGNGASTTTRPPRFAGAAKALVGTWEADVTQEALTRAHISPSESGEVGHWRLTITEAGRMTFEGPHVNLDVPVEVDGNTLTVTIDTGPVELGRGEVWRYSWSVFRDTLTLERLPGRGFQAGPTFLVSQPFQRA